MFKKGYVINVLTICFIMTIPSLSHGIDICGQEHDRWTIDNAFVHMRNARNILGRVANCYGDDWTICRDAYSEMETARDHLTQVIMISRGVNCRYCNINHIIRLGDEMERFAQDIYRRGYKSGGFGFSTQYRALAEEPLCSSSQSNPSGRTELKKFCVTVSSNKGWQKVNVPTGFKRISKITGSWNVYYSHQQAGPEGYKGALEKRMHRQYKKHKYVKTVPFAALLMKDSGSVGIVWVKQAPQVFNGQRLQFRINDNDDVLSDNRGSLKLCFGN